MRRLRVAGLILALAPSAFCSADAASAPGPKVYISVDMEGTVGAVTSDQLGPKGFEYARFREFMTREALAAVEAAKRAGAGEILVSDSHGNGENLLIEQFPPDVRIIRSWPRRLAMMAGIDDSFDAVIFIGYHSSTDNPQGVRAHTFSSARLTSVKLNGTPVTEGAFNAAIAGHFGVPVVMISGDDVVIDEVRSLVGDIEGAVVKKALGFHSAKTMTPEAAYALIGERVEAALDRIEGFRPHRLESPIELEISFKHYRPVEVLGYLRVVERVDSHTIRFRGEDMLEVSDFVNFVLNYDSNAQP
jgi:D-amino peptidase